MLLETESRIINIETPSLYEILVETSPTLILLPKLETLINKEELTLRYSRNLFPDEGLLSKLTSRSVCGQ